MGYRRDGNDRAGWDGWCWGSPATSRTAPEDVRRVLCHAAVDGACGGRVDRACGIVEPTAWRASLCSVPVRCNTCAHITSRNFIVLQYRCVQTTLSTVSQRILTKIHSVSFRCYSVIMKNAARVISQRNNNWGSVNQTSAATGGQRLTSATHPCWTAAIL